MMLKKDLGFKKLFKGLITKKINHHNLLSRAFNDRQLSDGFDFDIETVLGKFENKSFF